jgi:hypothetical protein
MWGGGVGGVVDVDDDSMVRTMQQCCYYYYSCVVVTEEVVQLFEGWLTIDLMHNIDRAAGNLAPAIIAQAPKKNGANLFKGGGEISTET